MTGTIELSDQDIKKLVDVISLNLESAYDNGYRDETVAHLENLKERLLKVEANEH